MMNPFRAQLMSGLQLFESEPGQLYPLDTAAYLAGIPRRTVLIYCKAGLVEAISDPGYGGMLFDEASIQRMRRAEALRNEHGVSLTGLKIIFDLLSELEELREEVRFLRER